jgi:tetrahydromethanopterin S-methyltransferase subunit G
MTSLEGVVGALVAGAIGLFFWLFKRSHTRIDELDKRLDHAVSDAEVRQIVEDKLAPLTQQHRDFSNRLGRLEHKIDQLIALAMKK